MTQQPPPAGPPHQPPYGVPSGYPPGHQPQPRKPRPSAGWFVLGIALILVAVVAAVGLFVWTISGFFDTDARVPADGQPHQVSVGTDGDRMLWVDDTMTHPACRIVDRATGRVIAQRPVGGDFRRDRGAGDWVGASRFSPGSGHLTVRCVGRGGSVEIGSAPRIRSFVVGIVATIVVPLVLGLAGLVVLLVTGILWSSRPARPRATG